MAKKKRTRAVAYLRKSTNKQEASIPTQREAVTEYAKKNGYRILREYVDEGISGDDTERRTEFLRMHADATGVGDFDAILCWDIDRFGRFDSIEAGYWIKPLRDAGVKLVTCTEGIVDWESNVGRLMYNVNQDQKHKNLRDHSQNIVRGSIAAAQNGSRQAIAPYGYVNVGPKLQKRLALGDERHVATVRRIFEEYVAGRSYRDIARRLNGEGSKSPRGGVWCADTIKGIIRNEAYIGTDRFNVASESKYNHWTDGAVKKGGKRGPNDPADWIVHHDHHPTIVDKHTFALANARSAKGKTGQVRYAPDENPYVFSGKLVCGECGAAMNGAQRRNLTYLCPSGRDDPGTCPGCRITQKALIAAFVRQIGDELWGDDRNDDVMRLASAGTLTESDLPGTWAMFRRLFDTGRKATADPARIKRSIAKVTKSIDKARANLVLLDAENIPAAQARIKELLEERDLLRSQVEDVPDVDGIADMVDRVVNQLAALATGDIDDVRSALREVDRLVVFTYRTGTGTATRYTLRRIDIHFVGARGPLRGWGRRPRTNSNHDRDGPNRRNGVTVMSSVAHHSPASRPTGAHAG